MGVGCRIYDEFELATIDSHGHKQREEGQKRIGRRFKIPMALKEGFKRTLKKLTCRSTRFWPLRWTGAEQRVFCPRREKVLSVRTNQTKWQSQVNALSDSFNVRRCTRPANMSLPSVVSLLLLSVLQRERERERDRGFFEALTFFESFSIYF